MISAPVLYQGTVSVRDAQDYILGYFQPSLPGLFLAGMETQDCVLGYSQPELSKLARKWPSGRRNLLNAWKRTWTSEIRLVLWQCFRPSISTKAKVGHGP